MNARAESWRDLVVLLAVFAFVAAVRITAPSDRATGDQPYQVDYIRDIVHHDAWIAQHLANGTAATKPPLYNWLAAIAVLATGSEGDFVLKLPSLIAGLLTLLLVWDLSRRIGSRDAALYAGLFLIASTMFSKQIYFARTDMLLTFFILMQIWAALRHEEDSRAKWVVTYWIAASLSMLTKGPIGVVIPLLGLSIWWWRRGVLRSRLHELHVLLGLTVSTAVFAAWFLAAVAVEPGVFDQLVYAETLDRFKADSSKSKENRHVFYYIPHFVARMAPASVLAIVAAVHLIRRRGDRDRIGALLWCVLATFVMLSLVPSKRADRLFPLFPSVAILAGWAVSQLDAGRAALRWIGGVLLVVGLGTIASPLIKPIASAVWVIPAGLIISIAALVALRLRSTRTAVLAVSLAMLSVITVYQFQLNDVRPKKSSSSVGIQRP